MRLLKPTSWGAGFWLACAMMLAVIALGIAIRQPSTKKQAPAAAPPPVAKAPAAPAPTATPEATFAGVMVEAEDLKPQGAGWKAVMNGQGNYMVDVIGFQHISGERVLSGDADAKDAIAVGTVNIPEAGDYRVWSRFEQPTGTDNRFRVEVRQGGSLVGQAVMGEKDAPKYFFGRDKPVGQADPSWGSEGLVEQVFDLKGLRAGPAEVTLVAVAQPAGSANRNVDFLFFTRDTKDAWRANPKYADIYRILDAAQQVLPPRYYLRLTSPQEQAIALGYKWNRVPWGSSEPSVTLKAGTPSEWIPLPHQDVAHYTTLVVSGPAAKPLQIKAELSTTPNSGGLLRTIDWNDPKSNELRIALPPYPNKYPGEKILTVEEQYQNILAYLKANPSKIGKDPTEPLAWGGYMPIWTEGRVSDAAAQLYNAIGMRGFVGFIAPTGDIKPTLDVARARFKQWGLSPNRGIALGGFRQAPTADKVKEAHDFAQKNGILPYVQRYDYGDEIGFSEWLSPLKDDELKTRFAAWQRQNGGATFDKPDSSAAAATSNPELYVNSLKFYEETATTYVAGLAKEIPRTFGGDILYGANFAAHPFYYPEIAKYINWFRATPSGDYAANFGRHSEYFWQVGQPGPLINGYVADHFRAGMRGNPKAMLLQYTMPHSPGNTDTSFRRTAFTHLAHGAHGLDYFGIGINDTFTENYIDFRDAARYAAIRDVNRAMATIEDILPQSQVVPSKIALILSNSTERWDFAGIAMDKAGAEVFGDNYKKVRMAFHIDRLGIYYALVHNSLSPDLVTEDDVKNGVLKDYSVAYWAGDCIAPEALKALGDWVNNGGRLVATAGAFRFDQYKKPQPAGLQLLGLQAADLEAKEYFFRPQIELPRMKPLDMVGSTPALGLRDKITPLATTKTIAGFKGGAPAIVQTTRGRGTVTYIATLPGAAYLWSAYQPAPIPSRGPSSHMPLTKFNKETARQITAPAQGVFTNISARGSWLDARLLQSPKGFAVSLANYSPDTGKPVQLTIRGAGNVRSITSAVAGNLTIRKGAGDEVTVQYSPGLGDILRIG